ncbi:TPA: hypothetical protein EYP66_11530 [Candidatus Poribacteria bacterium]|nr:hypothetical protein [Candidatus Poribacteria bacterium]
MKKQLPTSEEIEYARKLLSLDECATLVEIKNAFRSMAKRYHPDKSVDGNEEMMKELNKAYEKILAFINNYRYCFNQKPAEEEYWEDFKERYYEDFII